MRTVVQCSSCWRRGVRLLVPLAGEEFRWVTLAVAFTYLVLALASYLDFRGRR
jgi:hypothetical protein